MDVQTELLALLSGEFNRARLKNPSYSLRAFAKKVGLQPSALSEILSGQRPFTTMTGGRVLDRIDIDPVRAEQLRSQLKGKYRSAPQQKLKMREFRTLASDQLHVISDWYYFAIRSLAETTGFKKDAAWIADRLGIPQRTASIALERLERMQLLSSPDVMVTTTHDVQSSALRRAHRQHMELAIESLEGVDVNDRDITGITMAMDPAKLPEAKKRIQKFRRDLCTYLESGNKQAVFRLNVQLFPMTKKRRG